MAHSQWYPLKLCLRKDDSLFIQGCIKFFPPPPKKSKILKRRGREGKRKGKEKGKEKGGKREGENKCYVWEGRKHLLYKSKMYVSSAAKIKLS